MVKLSLNKIKKLGLDILFPIECLACGKEDIWLCDECFKKIKLKEKDDCLVCKKQSAYGKTHAWCRKKTYLDALIVCTPFNQKIIQDGVHKLKYNFIQELATPLSQILINKIKQLDEREDEPTQLSLLFNSNLILIPVPLHARRLRWRGFNQAELLAEQLAKKFNLTVSPYILKRVRYTRAQTQLRRQKRLKNIKDVFKINPDWQGKLKSTKILLVDDVTTTGATLNECAKILRRSGVQEVWGIVLARG